MGISIPPPSAQALPEMAPLVAPALLPPASTAATEMEWTPRLPPIITTRSLQLPPLPPPPPVSGLSPSGGPSALSGPSVPSSSPTTLGRLLPAPPLDAKNPRRFLPSTPKILFGSNSSANRSAISDSEAIDD